ncbi:MAG: M20/M25/M40 family metallo-hydrolase [Hyphomicrobiales bacterium]|nr:M20/M25/M40 family metallo-hydrolase [Hyphomicrobiales bacterium]
MTDRSQRSAALARANAALKADSLQLLADLVEAGKGGPEAVDAVTRQAMQEADCDVVAFEYDPRSVPLVDEFASVAAATALPERCLTATIAGASGGPSLLMFAHPDTEDFHTEPVWQTDPFVPTVRDGRIYGWGVADDLAGIALLVQSVAILRAAGLRPGGDVVLVSSPSKKHRCGISAALHRGLSADAAIYLHPAESGRGLNEIKAFAPGQLEFMISIAGHPPDTSEPAHTAFASRAVNPFDKAMIVARALHAVDAERGQRVVHPKLQQAIGRSTNLMLSFCDFGAAGELSRIADECKLGGAMTLVPGESLAEVMENVEAAIGAASATDPWLSDNPPAVVWLSGVSAAETQEESALYQTVSSVLTRCGANPQVNPLHTSSDIRNPIVQKAIPTVGFGPLCGGLTMSGHADEWVDADDYLRAIAATAEIITEWCGADFS